MRGCGLHKPELYYSAELTEYEQSILDMGIEVERVARNLFPQGVFVTVTKTEAQQNTLKCLASPHKAILSKLRPSQAKSDI